jgi:hypothetical protein
MNMKENFYIYNEVPAFDDRFMSVRFMVTAGCEAHINSADETYLWPITFRMKYIWSFTYDRPHLATTEKK